MTETSIYCGPAPVPATVLRAWNADWFALLLCAVVLMLCYRSSSRYRTGPLLCSVSLFALLFVSPLCALTAALFAARSVHHVLLIAAVAPLLALAVPRFEVPRVVTTGWLVAIQAAVLWFWHIPSVYSVAVENSLAYWSMQLSLLAAAYLLWQRILDPREHAALAVLASLGTAVQMGMLGALLTFAATPLYEVHLQTTLLFGLSPLQDQQLGGIVMWVPAALPYLAAALYRAWPLLTPSGNERWSG